MADQFSLDDALAGQTNASGQQTQSEGQNWNNQWGGPGQPYQAPGQYPGYPAGGQQYPGGMPPAGGQQYPGGMPPAGGQQYPGGMPPAGGQQYPGGMPPAGGQPYPGGMPPAGQPYPGGFPGFPGFPAPGQQYPVPPAPGQPTDPKVAGQSGPTPSAPFPSAPGAILKIPHSLPLQAGIMPGLVVTINGVVNPNAKRFNVDLKAGNDIVLHWNPRFDENPNVVVRNAMFNGRWGSEERGASKFPFKQGQNFMLQIFIEQEQYRLAVNNESFCQFKHRNRDFARINVVYICGDITLNGATVNMM